MKKFELIVGLIVLFGIFLTILHIPGGRILTVYASSILSMFYYIFSFAFFNGIRLRDIFKKTSYKDTNVKRIIGAIGVGLALSQIIIGGVLKLQFWSGTNNIFLPIGLVNTAIILLIAIIFYFRNKADFYKMILRRIVIYGGLGLILYLTPSSLLVVVNQYKAESLQYLSVGHRPTERNAPQIQALQGRHLYYAFSGLNGNGTNLSRRAMPYAIDNRAFSPYLKSIKNYELKIWKITKLKTF